MTVEPNTPNQGITWRRTALTALLLAGTSLGGYAISHASMAETAGAALNSPGTVPTVQALPDFTQLVAQAKPAVVSITSKLKANSQEGSARQDEMPHLPFPFSQLIPQRPQAHAVEGSGSGFIINASGTIVTNNHVVKDAESVTVTLDDGSTLPAKVIGRDSRTDIAVLKVDAGHPLPYIQLGNSTDVKPGEWVVAMGNPFGLGGTVTAGIVSAVSRDIGDTPYDQFIQIDAPINQGNSGGPLFTQDGKVVGMNSAILSPTGGSVGIGFAIPSNVIRSVTSQLEASGHVTRGYIGVEAQELTGVTARALRLADNGGALLSDVLPNGPADKAGLKPGDVIQSLNGQKVTNPHELALDIAGIKPGEDAHLTVLHDGHSKAVTLKVAQLPNEEVTSNGSEDGGQQKELGLALAPLSPEMRNQLDVPEGTQGAVVRDVQSGSPADEAGLQAGDVIVGVGTHPVRSPADVASEIRSAINSPDHAVALRVLRGGEPLFVGIQMSQAEG
jgi:serine protease Do